MESSRATLSSKRWSWKRSIPIATHRVIHLRGNHQFIASSGDGFAHDLLALATGVGIGGIDEVDPGIERLVDDADAFGVVGVAHLPEHHRSEAITTDRDASGPE